MDNYLLMGHILKCKVIPIEKVHPNLWIGANRKWRAVPHDRVARVQHNKVGLSTSIPHRFHLYRANLQPRTESERLHAESRLLKRQMDRKRKIAEAGISYVFGSAAYVCFPVNLRLEAG